MQHASAVTEAPDASGRRLLEAVGVDPRAEPADGRHDREELLQALTDSDPSTRRRALDRAVLRFRLRRGEATVLYAVAIDHGTPDAVTAAFARQLGARRSGPLRHLGGRDHVMLLLGQHGADDVFRLIREEGARRSIRIEAIGSARHSAHEDDLRPAVDRAVTAARIASLVAELPDDADISELGPWAMLAMVPCDRSALRIFSPAAFDLCAAGERGEVQRRTVEVLLDSGSSPKLACQQLHIHRATLYYRLEHMPPSVQDALDDGVRRSALHLCLKLIRLWESAGLL
jgi:hypothetical protein